MSVPLAAVEAHDPRVHLTEGDDIPGPDHPVLHDGSAPNFETYLHFAEEQRAKEIEEARREGVIVTGSLLSQLWPTKKPSQTDETSVVSQEKKSDIDEAVLTVPDSEYRAASSSLRTATWGSIFYLITTDILGPYSTPFAFAQVGYGPGVACFVVFGAMAAYSGVLLWHMFLKLDSEKYPLRSFADLAYRIYGRWFRHLPIDDFAVCNILQSLQLIFNVGLIILGNGQGLSQMSKFKYMYLKPALLHCCCNVVWTIAGMLVGQIRTLQKFSWIANFSIWLNIITLLITMGAVAHSSPNYEAANSAYVHTLAINNQPFQPQLNGIMQIVFSYGGAMIFIEFMAEMRRPMDFWKAMAYAQLFITFGQFVINPANQGISLYSLQTATNAISLIAGLIAAALYGNIGVKVIYQNVLVEIFRAPQLTTKRGKYFFSFSVVLYWAFAFIIGSAIPQFFQHLRVEFTYTFPPFMILGYMMQYDAMDGDRPYNVNNPRGSRIDSWKDASRWHRGFKRHSLFNTFNIAISLACLATAILASYAAISSIVVDFQTSNI
ncbi:hypothetical protein BU15DRAFT_85879 [Melanogaster broomeanus]|nr:hypothetical protein BU15DRAFT_85879 [Melanogaster broomeanus]